jgi:hypothetical protein
MPRVTEQQYLDEMNRRLRLHDAYRPGMRFMLAPEGALPQDASGYTWEPFVDGNPYPFSAVAQTLIDDGWTI